MSFPFGGHPTFGQYMAWAAQRGCQVNSGVRSSPNDGAPVSVTRIVSPDGKRWVIDATDQTEYLTATTIARLNRRLGLDFPLMPAFDDGSPSEVPN
jgi:hypothetical protein